jgi:ER membrane protein complex subunit 1
MRLHALLLAALPSLTSAIFADDAYTIDYHEVLLGQPQSHTTFFHKPQSSSNASLLYTVSDKAVLGAVNPKDGSVLWRQALSPAGPISNATSKSFLVAGLGDGQVTSGYGSNIRTWDALDGKLVWEYSLPGGHIVHGLQAAPVLRGSHGQGGQTQDVVVLTGDGHSAMVVLLAGDGSGVRWKYSEDRSDTPVSIHVTGKEVYYVSSAGGLLGGKTRVTSLDAITGKEEKHVNPSLDSEILTGDVDEMSMSCSGFPFVVTSGARPSGARYKDITINVLGSSRVVTLDLEHKAEEILGLSVHYSCDVKAPPHFLVRVRGKTKQWGEVFHIDVDSGKAVKSYVVPATEENSIFAASSIDNAVYFTRITDTEVVIYSSLSHGVLGRWPRRGRSPPGLHAAAEVVSRGKTLAVRIAMTSRYGVWSLVRNGELQWARPEILAYATNAVWANGIREGALASELEAEESANPLTAYMLRVKRHTEELMLDLPQYIMSLPQTFSKNAPAHVDPKSSMLGSKLIITATSRHQVVAVDAITGDIEWMKDFSFFAIGGSHITSLLEQKGLVWIYRSDGSFSVLDTIDGSTIEHKPASIPADKIIAIPGQPDATIIKISDGIPQVSEETPSTATEGNSILTIHPIHGARGWTVGQSVQQTWTIKPPAGAKIVNAVARPAHDPVASIGKVLGDRSVLYKYLSPNLALLTAISSTTLTIYLIEAITGTILHTSTHSGIDTTSPIASIMSENWFAYSFTSRHPTTSAITTQIVISELYESAFPNDRGALPTTANFSTFSADALHPPHIISQSYTIAEPISHMSVTQTTQGITSRSLLGTLPNSGAIIGIPLHMLNARRPVDRDPTSLEMEEGLLRYHPHLELAPLWYLTHARELLGIEKVTATPSLLESTSLVVGYGHDLFGTRVSPSMAFDVLDKGFNKISLLLTIAGLAVATAALAPLVRRKQVDGRWKM